MLSDELIAKIGTSLEAMPLEPTSRRELEQLVSHLAAKIRAAQARGATYAEIAKQITASGYPIKRSTLCAALLRQRKSASKTKPAQRLASPPSQPPSGAASTQPGKPQRSGGLG